MKRAKRASIKYLLVDGYNLINAWPDLKSLAEMDLEEARNSLNELLVEYNAYSGEKIIIVYDAYMVKGTADRQINYKGLSIVFTREHQTADSYIEIETEVLTKDMRNVVRVVTSDWAEQQMVMGSGAVRVSPREFFFEIERMETSLKRKQSHEQVNHARMVLGDRIDAEILKVLDKWRKQ